MLGQYRVEAPVGAGGMGAVYRAYDTTLRRRVAIKLLTGTTPDDPGHRAVLREARAASRLNHPNICAIHEVGEADGQPFIVMEFVDGRSLSALVPPDGLPVQTVLQLGAQIAGAVAHAHGQGIVHRDLKPANVAVTADGRVKILDFGVAARLSRAEAADETVEATRTADSVIAGTPAYMAPEAIRGEPPRESADIWAIGVLLFEMTTGRRPFTGDSVAEVVSAIVRDPVTLPHAIPGGLRRLILRCLQKDPAQRYASAAEVRAALDTMAETLEQDAGGVTVPPADPRRRAVAMVLPGQRPQDSFRRIPVFGGPSTEIAPWTWEIHFAAAVHPVDGRVAYVLREPDQPWRTLVLDSERGTEADVERVLADPGWSADGRVLLGAWQNQTYSCDAETLGSCAVTTAGSRPYLPGDGSRLYFFRAGPSPLHPEIWVRELASGAERLLRTVGRFRGIDIHFHVSDDGAIVWAPFQEGRHELWMAELR
jgi:hypothetical protein